MRNKNCDCHYYFGCFVCIFVQKEVGLLCLYCYSKWLLVLPVFTVTTSLCSIYSKTSIIVFLINWSSDYPPVFKIFFYRVYPELSKLYLNRQKHWSQCLEQEDGTSFPDIFVLRRMRMDIKYKIPNAKVQIKE